MQIPPVLISSVLVAEETAQSMRIPIGLFATKDGKIVDTNTLLGCRAGANLIYHHFALKN
ncbi:hypothetical protein PAXRUDRAFT_167999 [Paxillus rubicundulus Ve08.2h10]|uniref:Uncharacterized protein n=1 Tax=Paxillus rubicundulus Ve08.2h10 TaxID=930991 RepID=A0A0D0D0H2_9AGAM|nr:hypothetical protein PAXRUDRAFT_167999 [Paxillus rubicundulus Ve08.2h10]